MQRAVIKPCIHARQDLVYLLSETVNNFNQACALLVDLVLQEKVVLPETGYQCTTKCSPCIADRQLTLQTDNSH